MKQAESTSLDIPTADVLGIPVARVDLQTLLLIVADLRNHRGGRPLTFTYANAHTCNLAEIQPDFRRAISSADLIYADGNGPRVAAMLAGQGLPPRMTGADLINDLCAMCAREGLSIYLLGALPGVAEEAAIRLQSRFQELSVAGTHHGYFEESDSGRIVGEIQRRQPDILILGMGSPRQETWMAANREALPIGLIWAMGGALDYASGRLRRPPLWMRRLGLEWLGRVLIEPRRLAGRYFIGLPAFLLRALRYAALRRLRRSRPPAE